jgi:hypothetical protein
MHLVGKNSGQIEQRVIRPLLGSGIYRPRSSLGILEDFDFGHSLVAGNAN